MNEYDIVKAFQEMEETLIKSMSRNLARHLNYLNGMWNLIIEYTKTTD